MSHLDEDDPKFLEPINQSYFESQQNSSFEIYNKYISDIPFCPSVFARIVRAHLVNCRLVNVPIGLSHYQGITLLNLSDNQLSRFPSDFFLSFARLTTLDLSSNCIKEINFQLPSSLQKVDLSYNPGIDITFLWNQELPNLQSLKASHCKLRSLHSHTPNWRVKHLSLEGNLLSELPPYFKQLELLEELTLFGNHFTSFPHNISNSIKNINLAYNLINSDTIYGEKTTSINLSSNPFSRIPKFSIPSLRTISISKCNLSGELDFELPPQLIALDISNNSITLLSPRLIQSVPNLAAINASHNKITQLPDCFPQTNKIVRLLLDDNLLQTLPPTLLNAPQMELLTISNNCLTELPNFFLPQLRSINLSNNQLSTIPDCFSHSVLLTDVNFSGNCLTNLPLSLRNCRRMVNFLVGFNELTKTPICIFAFTQLKTLSLAGNHLNHLTNSFSSLHFLKNLDLSVNAFSSVPSQIQHLRCLKVLNMSHNCISKVNFLPQSLTMLDLSYNKISEFPKSNFPQLLSLSLDYNQLTNIDISQMPILHFLSVSANKLSISLIDLAYDCLIKSNFRALECIGISGDLPPLRCHVLNPDVDSLHFSTGYSAMQGDRPTMEDAVLLSKISDDASLFAVFDGHTGNIASQMGASIFEHEVKKIISNDDNLLANFSECFQNVQNALLSRRHLIPDGTTAAVALIKGRTVYASGIGDSRCVRVKEESVERLTEDFKPLMRKEFDRLRECGMEVNSEGRINRKLGVARTIGDFWCKPTGGLFVKPDVEKFELEDDDVGLVIACDGLWDKISDEKAGEILRNAKSAVDAAVTLKCFAYSAGSKDNISVITVRFKDHPGFDVQNYVDEIPVEIEEEEEEESFPEMTHKVRQRRR